MQQDEYLTSLYLMLIKKIKQRNTSKGEDDSSASVSEVKLGAPGLSDKSFRVGSEGRCSIILA